MARPTLPVAPTTATLKPIINPHKRFTPAQTATVTGEQALLGENALKDNAFGSIRASGPAHVRRRVDRDLRARVRLRGRPGLDPRRRGEFLRQAGRGGRRRIGPLGLDRSRAPLPRVD